MKKFYTVNIVLLVFMLSTLISYGQTPKEKAQITRHYNKTKIQQLQLKFSAEYLKQKEEALKAAKTNNWPVIIEKEGSYAELQRLALDGSPIYYTTRNQDAAISTRTDYINIGGASGLALDGQNMTAHVWDGGIARSTHQEYDGSGGSNRFSIGDGTATIDDHATHVTGTMIASGVETASKGMAPRAQAIGYDWNGDLSEVTIAAMDGMLISNHSYGEDSFSLPDYYFGAYTTISRDWDDLFYNAPYYLMVMAGGNTGNVNYNDSPLEGNSTYDKFVGFEICKNNIVVANAQDAIIDASGNLVSANINSSSSQGPTDDYRIKPDITGNGTGVYSTGSDADAHYDTKTGTSMASPNVAGSLLLLQQHANNLNGNFMRAATLKGLALHTADDIGPVGPDAVHGWGLLNAKRAARTLSEDGGFSLIQELTLGQGQSYSVEVEANGLEDLIASISWTDPAGSTTTNLNDPTPRLVNDLDIKITKSVNEWFPWRLTGVDTNANDSDNLVDPFERIEVTNPTGIYTVTVTHKGTLTNLSQNYSLIITGIQPDCTNAQIPSNIQASVTTTTAVINWNHFIPEIYDLRYRETGESPWSEISDLTISSTTLVDLKYSTEYELQIRSRYPDCTPTAYSNSIFFTTAPLEYCDAGGNGVSDSALGEKLSNVSFNTIDNNSTSTEGYEDFTSIYTTLAIGETYSFEATISNAFPTDQIIVWIDYNQDGDFEDVGELVYTSPLGVGPHSKDDIVISSNALLGMTGMRVRLHDSSVSFQPNNTPCGDSGYGQVEDYTVVIYEENQVIQPDANNILYVNKNVTGGNGDGSSWANAVPELADALKWAKNNEDATWATIPLQIWVAGGTYKPLYSPEDGVNFGTDQVRDNSFLLVNNVQLYGSFAGTETSLVDRNLTDTYTSILSGDIGVANDTTNNTYHVVVSAGAVGTALLDGFEITNGEANGTSTLSINSQAINRNYGGGMYLQGNSSPTITHAKISANASAENGGGMFLNNSSPVLTNVTLIENNAGGQGGGMFAYDYANASLSNVTFSDNTASTNGGAVYNFSASPSYHSVIFTGNTAGIDGGAIFNFNASTALTNVVLEANVADNNGGAMFNDNNSAPILINVLITGNSGIDGGGIYNNASSSDFTNVTLANNSASGSGSGFFNVSSSFNINNSILWDSFAGTASSTNNAYSLIKGVANTANSNIDATGLTVDDVFTNAANGNYSLKPGSPAINTGNNTAYTNAGGDLINDVDLAGNSRFIESSIDMGAYEKHGIQPDANNILYVDKNVIGDNGDGSSWANALPELADALKWAKNNEAAAWATTPLQIWVAGGTYNPLYSPEDGVNFGTDQARDNSFLLVNNVQLYGGFAGTETSLAARDLSIVGNASVLSGDIGALNDTSDNTYHVMVSSGNIGSGLLNGFTITEGNANGSSFIVVNGTSIQRRRGGGMNTRNSSPSLLNIIINGNNASELGGGMFFRNGSFIVGSPTITNCTFTENTAGNAGGGICLDGTDGTTITNTIFEGNTANNSGGGMANLFCSPTIINTTFSENTANNDGGGIFNFEFSSPTITNCVFWENEANGNTTSSSASVTNFSGSNSTITFSLIANSGGSASWDSSLGTDSGNNIDLDPLFVDVVANDFSLQKGSLAINAGNNTAYQTATGNSPASDTDINGNARLFQSTIDMGAYEADFNQSQWRGTTSEDWSTNTNWDEGFPDDQSVALIRDISLNTPKIDAPTIAEVRDLILAENAALNVQGVLKVNAEIQNNGQVTFTSNEMKTGQLDEFSGTYSGTGTVEVERFIPAGDNDKRAFRFLSSSVNSTGSINTNWQEGAATWNENPNPGFGTHITGSLAGADGFDASGSGNPSLFLYPSAAQTWSSIANTDVKALEAGAAYRLMVRGDRSIDLTSNAADPTNTILRSKGSLVFGTIDMSSELAQGADQFSLVGNPYQSVVDFSAVNKNNLRDYVYVWDASLTGANGRGAYVIVEVSSNSIVEAPAASSSSATKFIAPNQAFFVRNTSAGSPTLVFEETNKATAQAQVEVFNTYADFYINSRLYKTADLQNGNTEADAIGLRFSSQHTTEADEEDAEKLANPDENYAIINNGLRAIDKQNLPEDGHEIELFTNSYTTTAYSLTFAMDNLPEGLEVFLNDS